MMIWPEHIQESTHPVSLAELRTMDLLNLQELLLEAFKRLGYSVWLSESLDGKLRHNILLKDGERYLVQCGQEEGLVDTSLIKDFRQVLEKEGIESGFFITTGLVTLSERAYLLDDAVDIIDAKRLPLFLKTVFGDEGLRKELTQTFERRRFPRFDLRRFAENKILRRVDTFYGAILKTEGEVTDISCGGIGFESADKISPTSLLRFELFLPDTPEAIKAVGKLIWQKAKSDSLGYNLGFSFFLLRDKDKEQISNFVKPRLSLEQDDFTQGNSREADPEFLSRLLIEKNIISAASCLDNLEERGMRRLSQVDIQKAEASVKRFFKKMFSKKCKILEVHKTTSGWEALAKKIDDWFEKRGYREVYEKKIYVIRLDDKFKVVSYSQVGSDYTPGNSDLETSAPIDTDKVREIVKEVVKEVSLGNKDNNIEKITEDTLKRLAFETAEEIEKRRESKDLQKKKEEEIKIKEAYISPLKEVKLERNFERIGKVKRAKTGIKKQVESLREVKNGKT